MALYRPSELKAFLKEYDVTPKKSLGQHFLIDGNIIRKMVAFADVQEKDVVVEIGPGPGVLTEALLNRRASLIAIEKDFRFAKALKRYLGLKVIERDVLMLDWKEFLPAGKRVKVVANIPYNITSPIIEKIVENRDSIESATLMVQKEVAERMVAKEKTKERSAFSLFIQFYASLQYGFTVSKKSFYPPPKVDSAVIQLTLKEKILTHLEKPFFEFVHSIFCYRRKMVQTSLKKRYDPIFIEQAFTQLGLHHSIRPQELALEKWVELFLLFHNS